jgi:hypothetical protein
MEHSVLSMMTVPFCISHCIATSEGSSILVDHLAAWNLMEKALDSASEWLPHPHLTEIEQCSSVNIPWPRKGMSDADYIHAFQQIVMPIGMEFAPDLVISAFLRFSYYPCTNGTKSPLALTLLQGMILANVLFLQQDTHT